MRRGGRKPTLRDLSSVLALFSVGELAAALGVKYTTASMMRQRGWAEPAYWVPLIAAMSDRGLELTPAMLCQWAFERGPIRPKPAARSRSSAPRRASLSATGPPP
jgi:hypothetical protein